MASQRLQEFRGAPGIRLMKFIDIEHAVEGADRTEMESLFAPFILREVEGLDAKWDEAVEKRWRRVNQLYFQRRLLGWLPRYRRTDTTIKAPSQPSE